MDIVDDKIRTNFPSGIKTPFDHIIINDQFFRAFRSSALVIYMGHLYVHVTAELLATVYLINIFVVNLNSFLHYVLIGRHSYRSFSVYCIKYLFSVCVVYSMLYLGYLVQSIA